MSKKKHSTPNIPATTLLHLRLEGLWQNPSLPTQSAEQIENDLQTLARNSKPDQFIAVLINTFQGMPPLAREHLEKILPHWLARQHYLESLEDFHAISQTGRAAEEVMRFEEKVGRRVIADDGKEIFIGAGLANTMMKWDREGWQDEDDK